MRKLQIVICVKVGFFFKKKKKKTELKFQRVIFFYNLLAACIFAWPPPFTGFNYVMKGKGEEYTVHEALIKNKTAMEPCLDL